MKKSTAAKPATPKKTTAKKPAARRAGSMTTEVITVEVNGVQMICEIKTDDGKEYAVISRLKGVDIVAGMNQVYTETIKIPAKIEDIPVRAIGNSAFYDCHGFTSVIIPDSVEIIDVNAFGNSSLESVTIPDSVTCIEDEAFTDSNLKRVTLSNSITNIARSTFWGCDKLRHVTIPDSVTSIGDFAFSYCCGLEGITIGNGVTSIGNKAFLCCDHIKKVSLPGHLKGKLNKNVFEDCPKGLKVTYRATKSPSGDRVTNRTLTQGGIVSDASMAESRAVIVKRTKCCSRPPLAPVEKEEMKRRRKMGKEIIEETVNGITWKFKFIDNYRNALLMRAPKSVSGDVAVPEKLGGAPMTAIWGAAFDGCNKLRSVVFPDSVIRCFATFYGCSTLESITISAGMTQFVCSAFRDELRSFKRDFFTSSLFKTCRSLREIKVSEQNPMYKSANGLLLSKDGKTVLVAPGGITSATIPDGVLEIGETAFEHCNSLENVTIPSSVKKINSDAFNGCTKLQDVIIPDGVQEIGDSAFSGCCQLKSMTIPPSVKKIDSEAFNGCTKLQGVIVSDGVQEIGEGAFSSCGQLKSITIPASVKKISTLAFNNCYNLEHVTFSDGMSCIIENEAFLDCYSLERVSLPAGVKACRDAFPEEVEVKRVKRVK